MFCFVIPCFFYDPTDVGHLISGSFAFSKSSLYIWKFSVYILLKPTLKDFEHDLASMWNEGNCMIVWTFFGITFLWDWNEDWTFPVLWPLLNFPNLLTYWVQHFNSIIFWHSDFISFGYIPRSGNAALHCHSTFNFLKKFHTIFHSYCTNLHSHQQWVSLFPTASPTLILLMSSWQVWGDTSLWFGFAFPWWWMMLSIFSFVCCPSVCFLWKKCLFSSSAQFWKFFFFFFCC